MNDGAELPKTLAALLRADRLRMRLLLVVEALELPDCWIGAGFVRAAVWDHLHGRPPSALGDDVDVVWFDHARASARIDQAIEAQLRGEESSARWSVKNQARMHVRNGDGPYASTEEAVRRWPETATAVAVRLSCDEIEVLAPYGLTDLFSMTVRPTPAFIGNKLPIFQQRVTEKRWFDRWPLLSLGA